MNWLCCRSRGPAGPRPQPNPNVMSYLQGFSVYGTPAALCCVWCFIELVLLCGVCYRLSQSVHLPARQYIYLPVSLSYTRSQSLSAHQAQYHFLTGPRGEHPPETIKLYSFVCVCVCVCVCVYLCVVHAWDCMFVCVLVRACIHVCMNLTPHDVTGVICPLWYTYLMTCYITT